MPTKLIAKVAVVAIVDGQRQEFQPGDELPEGALSDHDIQELKRMGSVEDLAETANAEKADARAEARANAEFQREREKVAAAQASTGTKQGAAKNK